MQEWWAFELECELILKYKDEGLCNITDGGAGTTGWQQSKETKQKLLEKIKSEAWRKNISVKAKARFADEKYRQEHSRKLQIAMSKPAVREKLRLKALQRFSNPEEVNKVRKKTIEHFSNPEARRVASQNTLRFFSNPENRSAHVQAKAVMCIETGVVFGTCTLAAEWLRSTIGRGDNSQISKVCRGVIKTAHGYTWKYVTQPKVGQASP